MWPKTVKQFKNLTTKIFSIFLAVLYGWLLTPLYSNTYFKAMMINLKIISTKQINKRGKKFMIKTATATATATITITEQKNERNNHVSLLKFTYHRIKHSYLKPSRLSWWSHFALVFLLLSFFFVSSPSFLVSYFYLLRIV